MENVQFDYSMKNIPIPPNNVYKAALLSKVDSYSYSYILIFMYTTMAYVNIFKVFIR